MLHCACFFNSSQHNITRKEVEALLACFSVDVKLCVSKPFLFMQTFPCLLICVGSYCLLCFAPTDFSASQLQAGCLVLIAQNPFLCVFNHDRFALMKLPMEHIRTHASDLDIFSSMHSTCMLTSPLVWVGACKYAHMHIASCLTVHWRFILLIESSLDILKSQDALDSCQLKLETYCIFVYLLQGHSLTWTSAVSHSASDTDAEHQLSGCLHST